jgi:hypothetical protein
MLNHNFKWATQAEAQVKEEIKDGQETAVETILCDL